MASRQSTFAYGLTTNVLYEKENFMFRLDFNDGKHPTSKSSILQTRQYL